MVQRELQWADDLERAAAIQRQLLPRPLSGIDGVDVAAVCIPAFVVGETSTTTIRSAVVWW